VIAPKATKPFIRFCGDYRWLNSYVLKTQAYIPRVQYKVEKAMGFKIFLDIDMTNSFHQFPLIILLCQNRSLTLIGYRKCSGGSKNSKLVDFGSNTKSLSRS